jgi:hypothetical protein
MLNSQELYQQANQLPPLEKLRLAELLLADLDTPDPTIDAIWLDEAQIRWKKYQAGELTTVSYEEVMEKYKCSRLSCGSAIGVR